jgi:hypothetical protein
MNEPAEMAGFFFHQKEFFEPLAKMRLKLE